MKKIIHIINGLDQGGSETALFRLLKSMHQAYQFYVIVLGNPGFYSVKIKRLGIPVYHLSVKTNPIIACIQLIRKIKRIQPDTVQTWLYHADLLGGLGAKLCGVKNIIWGIRCEGIGLKKTTRLIKKISALLSNKIPHHIVTNSKAASDNHIKAGYHPNKMQVIYNGFNASEFYPKDRRTKPAASPVVIGTLARFHQDKDYATLIAGIDAVCEAASNVYFSLCGQGCEPQNPELNVLLQSLVHRDKVILINGTDDPNNYLNTLDIFIQASQTESFPNSLAEAMLCGLPCIATNVGETSTICDQFAMLIPPKNSKQLALACLGMTQKSAQERLALGEQARNHIKNHFSIEQYKKQVERLYVEKIKGPT